MYGRPNWYYKHPPYCTCKDCEFILPRSRNPLRAAIRELRLRAQRPVILPKVVDNAIGRIGMNVELNSKRFRMTVKWNSKHERSQ